MSSKGKVTAANAAALLGLDPYKTRKAAIHEMMNGKPKSNLKFNESMFEDAVALYEEEKKVKTKKSDKVELDGWFESSSIILVDNDGILKMRMPEKKEVKKEVPQKYYIEAQLNMFAAHRKWCDYVEFIDGILTIIRVDFDQGFINDNLIVLREMFEGANWTDFEIANEYVELKKEIDEKSKRLDQLKKELIKKANGEDAILGPVSIKKLSRKGTINYKEVVEEN